MKEDNTDQIQQLIEGFKDINEKLDKLISISTNHPIAPQIKKEEPFHKDDWSKIIYIDGNDFRFLLDIPGRGTPEKQVNATIIYLVLLNKYSGRDNAGSVSIVKFLENHGINTLNLSRALKKEKKYIIQKGNTGKGVSYAITTPGLIHGTSILNSLANN